jgi:hypothetical protein
LKSALVVQKSGPSIRFDFDNTGELTVSEWVLVLEMAKLQIMGYRPNTMPANMHLPGMLKPDLTRTPR